MKKRVINAFFEGQSINSYTSFGAHFRFEQTSGVRFSVYAPSAKRVQVIGDFNDWNAGSHIMEKVDDRGVWSVFVIDVKEGDSYLYRIEETNGEIIDKMDPYAFCNEQHSTPVSIVTNLMYDWSDQEWMSNRTRRFHEPLNIYEVNLKEGYDTYQSITKKLIKYVKEMHYTHVEFMPLSDELNKGSTNYFSVTSKYGTLQDLKCLVNELHKHDIGVIFAFVPTQMIENKEEVNNFDLHKEDTRSFLMSAAGYWLDELHGDGLRIDMLSAIMYWQGSKDYGINEGALTFIRRMNYLLHEHLGEVMLIAKGASGDLKVTGNTTNQGLGFDYKWDQKWMRNTLEYLKIDPIYRQQTNKLSLPYLFNEKIILPFFGNEITCRDELINRLWGDKDQKFAQARMMYIYMYSYPGKKLNIIGKEAECSLEDEAMEKFMKDLNNLYCSESVLYQNDYDYHYFEWLDDEREEENLFTFIRKGEKETLFIILNHSVNMYKNHDFVVLEEGIYEEILNSDSSMYMGSNIVNEKPIKTFTTNAEYRPYRIKIDVAPLTGIIIKYKHNLDKHKYFE